MRLGIFAAFLLVAPSLAADDPPPRRDPSPTLPGLKPSGAVLLPNGWSLKPAGRQSTLGDLPVVIAENPAEPVMAVLHAGYGEHEIWTISTVTGKTIARTALPGTFSGLVWSADGKSLYAGGGFDDLVYSFDQKDGLLSNRRSFEYPNRKQFLAEPNPEFAAVKATQRVPAGLALSKDGSTLYVANCFGHSLASFDTKTGRMLLERPLGKDSYPYGVLVDEGHNRLYVSLWGGAKVAIVDLNNLAVLGHYETQEHPNEMLAAKKGNTSSWPTPTATP